MNFSTLVLCRSILNTSKRFCLPLLHTFQSNHKMSSYHRTDTNPLFNYTSGRWLWNEPEQLAARFRRFNVPGLLRVACEAVGADKCMSFEKIGEGSYNKAYRLVMANGQRVIAKIPNPNAGPPKLTTASEVATMEFARTILNIPVPRVLAWSDTDRDPVYSEYIIMEEARGTQLYKVWNDVSLEKKCDILREFVDVERKLLSVSFKRLGALYFKDSGIEECEPAIVTNAPKDVASQIESMYCIGPITGTEFWKKERSEMQYKGPWTSAAEYLESIARREIEWISTHSNQHLEKNHQFRFQYFSPDQNSPECHIDLLEKFLAAVPYLTPQDAELVSGRLWHPDFHAGNIFFDEEFKMSSIIDWQGAWTTPVFIGAKPPKVLDYGVDMLTELPENFSELNDAAQKQLEYQVSQSVMIDFYQTFTREQNPIMYKLMHLPFGPTLKRLEAFAGDSWDNDLIYLRHSLIMFESSWNQFNADKPCPYHFSAEEIKRHQEEIGPFNKYREIWKNLEGIVNNQGFSQNETFSKAVEMMRYFRESLLNGKKGETRREFEEATRWVEGLDEHVI